MRLVFLRAATLLAFLVGASLDASAQSRADTLCSAASNPTDCLTSEYRRSDSTLNAVYAATMRFIGPANGPTLRDLQRVWIKEKDAGYAELQGLQADSARRLRFLIEVTDDQTELVRNYQPADAVFVPGGDSGQNEPVATEQPSRAAAAPASPTPTTVSKSSAEDQGGTTLFSANPVLIVVLGVLALGAAIAAIVAFIRSPEPEPQSRSAPAGLNDKSNIFALCALAAILLPWVTTSAGDQSISKSGLAFIQGWICLGSVSVAILSLGVPKWRPFKEWMLLSVALTPLLKAAELGIDAGLIAQAGYTVQASVGLYMTSAFGFLGMYTAAAHKTQRLRRSLAVASISMVALLVAARILVKPRTLASVGAESPRHVQSGTEALPENVKKEMLLQEMLNRGQISQEQYYLESTRLRGEPARDMLNDICANDPSAICQAQRYREQNGVNR